MLLRAAEAGSRAKGKGNDRAKRYGTASNGESGWQNSDHHRFRQGHRSGCGEMPGIARSRLSSSITYMTRQRARTVEDIHSLGGLAIAVQADVCDESQSSKLVGTAVDSFGGVDILVNNAFGRFSFDPRRRSTFAGGDWDEFSAQIEGCLHGAYLMCSHVVPLMRAQTSGRIINISSNLVDSPIVPYHSYITAKGGLVGMTRSLAQELGGFGITVNAIAAGLTAGTASSAATTEDVRERIIAMTPLGRLAVPMTSPEGSRCWRPTWPASLPDNVCTSMVG